MDKLTDFHENPNKKPASPRKMRLAGFFLSPSPLIPLYSKESQNIDKKIQITNNIFFGDSPEDGRILVCNDAGRRYLYMIMPSAGALQTTERKALHELHEPCG